MKLDRLITFFSTSPSAKLLRSPNSAYIIYFLNQQFKDSGNLVVAHTHLQQQLKQYLDQIHETEPEILRDQAEVYLTQWSTGESRWLRRYYDSQHAESVFELTPHTENVLKFLTDITERNLSFIGTESRLTRIIATLSDLVVRGSDDRERRLQHLKAERDSIEKEIHSIESGDNISIYSPTAIRERFSDAVTDLVSLQGDFRAVEESFKTITRDVQKQQAETADTRGQILGYALDAEERLKKEDQGASFDAFVKLILSPRKQHELEKTISQLDEIVELSSLITGRERMKSMVSSLLAEADKVLQTTRRLSTTLRRLLDTKAGRTRIRLASVLNDIQAAAAKQAENPPQIGIDVQTELDLFNISQRTFWQPPVQFEEIELENKQPDEDEQLLAFKRFAEMQHLDWDTMRNNVTELSQTKEQISLKKLLDIYPATNGSIEILGYIQLAYDDGHEVNENETVIIAIEEPGDAMRSKSYEIPRVVFLCERLRSLRSSNHNEGSEV